MNEEHEYYNGNVPKEILQQRMNFINFRWKELYELEVKYGNDAMRYLFLTNAGGAATVLAFMGTSSEIKGLCSMKVSLIFFAVGLILAGVLIAFLMHRSGFIFDQWRKDVSFYYGQKKKYSEILDADDVRSDRSQIALVIGYCSFGSFIIGLILGGFGLF